MSKTLKDELIALFMEEAASYIPAIRQNLTTLAAWGAATGTLHELHRLFHTLKGAASQVQLNDISKGARYVENFLDDLLEEGKGLGPLHLGVLERVTDLLEEQIDPSGEPRAENGTFHARVVDLFKDAEAGEEKTSAGLKPSVNAIADERRDGAQAVRSIIPLLGELAGCLQPGVAEFDDYNNVVFRKLGHAVAAFSDMIRAAGMDGQYQLMRDFRLLLDKLYGDGIWSLPEVAGLIGDFLQFLDAVFNHGDPENSLNIRRVKDRLQALQALLGSPASQLLQSEADGDVPLDAPLALEEDIFTVSGTDEDSLLLLDQLAGDDPSTDSDIVSYWQDDFAEEGEMVTGKAVGEEPEEQSEKEPAMSEDQQLLLEIFRAECEEHLIVINNSLNSLELRVEQPCAITPGLRETLSEMRRAVHTLKGAAAMTGVNLLAKGAHALEDLLDWLHDEATEIGPGEVGILATGIDVIERLSHSSETGGTAYLSSLVEMIEDYLAKAAGNPVVEELEETSLVTLEEAVSGLTTKEAALPDIDLQEENPASLPGGSGFLRVRLDDLDELIGIEGELVVARGAVEKMLEEFNQTLHEFDNVKENLRRKSQELESGFEVKSLYGFNPVASGGPGEEAGSDFSEFDPIELDRYSQLNLIIRSLNEITVDINSIHATLSLLAGDISGQIGKQQLTMRLMQDKLMRIRMTPMSSLSRMLFRTVRETAKKLEKKVNLVISGEDVYMDRFVWAKITDPLMHILRNAVDHGIEPARQRLAANKPEIATIRLEAEQHSRFVVLRVSDDGGGIDLARIKDKLRREGLEANPDALGEKELLEYLFHPSFSTREDISAISGRGVGLDVVRRNIQDLRGSVQLINRPGQGVTFEFQIPFTLSVNRAAIVSVTGREFAVPLQDILQVKRYGSAEMEIGDGLYLRYGEGLVPVVNLSFYLQLEGRNTDLAAQGEGLLAIVFRSSEKVRAVAVDQVVEQREIIVKNLGSHLTHVPGISGVTLTGTGELIPILNLRELMEIEAPATKAQEEARPPLELNEPLKVLIVDDSISVRHSVARLVESQAWRQQQAVDGVDALAKLESFLPDVIVLDIEMPRMNGYEFKSNINNNPMLRDIPVIMLTSRTSEKHQQKARDLGIHHYMTKPYQETAFIRLLENIRSGSR